MLAACTARHWLARHAAGVKLIRSQQPFFAPWTASGCAGLVSCLPALETVELSVLTPLDADGLGCLLVALAWCPGLRSLDLIVIADDSDESDDDDEESGNDVESDDNDEAVQAVQPVTGAPAFVKLRSLAQLRSLTKLALDLSRYEFCTLASVVDAALLLTGLTEMTISLHRPAVLPATLGQLKGLQALMFCGLKKCVLQAGCLDLPNLASLQFHNCDAKNMKALPGVAALQSLTCIEFARGRGPHFLDPQLVQLPRLQRMVFNTYACLGRFRLPADMGSLSSALLHLDFSGHGLTQFPLALTQLVALECLNACENDFSELPSAITALSRLTELRLGRYASFGNRLQEHEKCPLDVIALGDLSGFPALCELSFQTCEVKLCDSMLGALRHPNLASLIFTFAHPAPECLLMVLQLSQVLKRLRQRSVLKLVDDGQLFLNALKCSVQTLPPFLKFKAASEACGL